MLVLSMILPGLIAMFLIAIVAAYGARRISEIRSLHETRVYNNPRPFPANA